ncbi:unnamed protein product, partial [Brenthis ino]
MDLRIVLLVSVVLTFELVKGAFFYNSLPPTDQEYEERGLKCIPGQTVIRIEELKPPKKLASEEETRRTHMNDATKDEYCQICVCSVEGKEEYCSRRPARNVNECIRIAILKKNIEKNLPFSHERALSFRIRRDYIWHYDEIPYASKARCRRAVSYYSNDMNANNTDIDVPSDVESLLDYTNKQICFYCVCSVDGTYAGCIPRDQWFCEYYRIIREPHAMRESYKKLFQQDRPAYFRHLSYRLRRTMDDGMNTFMNIGGDALCCDHPDGHRRNLHEQVRNRMRMMRRKVPKENILAGSPRGDYVDFIVNND